MAFTVDQLNAIDNAIASGKLKVAFNGREVVYRSMSDLKSARDLIRQELMQSGAIQKSKRVTYVKRVMD